MGGVASGAWAPVSPGAGAGAAGPVQPATPHPAVRAAALIADAQADGGRGERVLVLGSGIIGLTTAYALLKRGYSVCVVERRSGPALETSFGNAGSMRASSVTAIGTLDTLATMVRAVTLGDKTGKIVWQWGPLFTREFWSWGGAFVRRSVRRSGHRREFFRGFSRYSIDHCRLCADELGLEALVHNPTVSALTTGVNWKKTRAAVAQVLELGTRVELLDRAAVLERVPQLAGMCELLEGGVFGPDDYFSDSFAFAKRLAAQLEELGTEFLFGTEATRLVRAGDEVVGVETRDGRVLTADHYVVALGPAVKAMAQTAGLSVPIYPVKGYSLTFTPSDARTMLESLVVVEPLGLYVTPLEDQRMRVTWVAEVSGADLSVTESSVARIREHTASFFPCWAADLEGAEVWAGLRPTSADGLPIVGRTKVANLYLNAGHGSHGWRLAFGCAELLSAVIADDQGEWVAYAEGFLGPDRFRL